MKERVNRQTELEALIKSAMEQPGVAEVMRQYGSLRPAEQSYNDAVRGASSATVRVTTDHTVAINPGSTPPAS